MISITIQDNQHKQYKLQINPDSLKKEKKDGKTTWKIEHEVLDGDKRIGFGHFEAKCMQNHEHLSDDKILEVLLKLNSERIISDINNQSDIESVLYNVNITDCTK
ncbi:hypothetical protein KJ782_01600 [Patescibacteria group bacterium]|nr:hypothetical protein [Patescibacteria group bacterium]